MNNVTPLTLAADANEEACARLEAAARAAAPAGATVSVFANPAHSQPTHNDLSAAQVELVGWIRQFGVGLGDMVADLMRNPDIDKRWASIATTHFQQGLMAATRAVTKPTTF